LAQTAELPAESGTSSGSRRRRSAENEDGDELARDLASRLLQRTRSQDRIPRPGAHEARRGGDPVGAGETGARDGRRLRRLAVQLGDGRSPAARGAAAPAPRREPATGGPRGAGRARGSRGPPRDRRTPGRPAAAPPVACASCPNVGRRAMTRREKRSTEVPPEVVAELLELARSRTMARVGRSISEAVLFRSRVAATFVVLVAAALGYSAALPLARLLAAL